MLVKYDLQMVKIVRNLCLYENKMSTLNLRFGMIFMIYVVLVR